MTKVVLEDSAFISILTSVFEVYDNECFGWLTGFKRKRHYVVSRAIPLQTAIRDKLSVSTVAKRELLLSNVVSLLTKRGIIGDYHSHTKYS